jgi:hypothetical protein
MSEPADPNTSTAVTGAVPQPRTAADLTAIRRFRVQVPEAEISELSRRITATRWPTRELVDDRSQGVQLAAVQALARYWATEYDVGRVEARLNSLPQFTTVIDGVDIHFVHVRSPHPDALPLIMTHGWPGSVMEMLDSVGPPPTRPRTVGGPRMRSTWGCRRCRATASPLSRPSSGGTSPGPRGLAPGRSTGRAR